MKGTKLIRLHSVFFAVTILLFSACRKYDNVFDQSPDTRLNETLNKYKSALTSSPAGWNASLKTGSGSTYHFHFRFTDSNRVFMFADINQTTATARESSYRLKALQTPSLLFDTYSYLHVLADPDATVNGGTFGQGLTSDFEFSIDSVTADSILLTGRVNNTKLVLKKASQQDLDAWQNGLWARVFAFENLSKIQNYFKRVTIGGIQYEIRVDFTARTITFSWLVNGNLQQFTTGYSYSAAGVLLDTPFNTGTQTISALEIVSWDANTTVLNIKVNGNNTSIAGATKPLKVDLTAPQRWWQFPIDNGGTYWISINGFHVNGVEDAFNIKSLKTDTSQYYYLIYWPRPVSGQMFDVLAPIYYVPSANGLDLIYGMAQTPNFTADGRIIFNYLGDLTIGPYPTTGPAAQTKTQLLLPQGYYFVQTGPTSYDMVSSTDAKAWISWVF